MRLLLALALSLAALPAFAGPASDAVRFFYTPEADVTDPALRDRFIDPALAKFKQDDKLSNGGTEIGCIDFALQYDAQDLDDAEMARTLKLTEDVKGDKATVTAKFNLFPTGEEAGRSIVWSLKQVGGAWKIADIASGSGDWKLSDFECQ